jgi:2,3-bisphosphoglycerate-dependent phosphoglycerate mutase
MLGEMQQHWVPVKPTWSLNERHYGALTGMSKPEAMEKLGSESVSRWRKSWNHRPPPIEADHPLFDKLVDRRYAASIGSESSLPSSESLEDVSKRVVSFFHKELAPALRDGKEVLVVAHGESEYSTSGFYF